MKQNFFPITFSCRRLKIGLKNKPQLSHDNESRIDIEIIYEITYVRNTIKMFNITKRINIKLIVKQHQCFCPVLPIFDLQLF